MLRIKKTGLSILSTLVLLIAHWSVNAQCRIDKDAHGQIVTTCEVYTPQIANSEPASSHNVVHYLGSEFSPSLSGKKVLFSSTAQARKFNVN
jgi:hypothetical protein